MKIGGGIVSALLMSALFTPASAERIIVRAGTSTQQANVASVRPLHDIPWDIWEMDDKADVLGTVGELVRQGFEAYQDMPAFTTFIPNDSVVGWQHFQASDVDIDTPEAWDITTGGEIKIGLIDTGFHRNHPDLVGSSWVNPGEIEGNGIDDDLNGFIDDIWGWDFAGVNGTDDNDPTDVVNTHGTFMAGELAAKGNNGIGIAGVSWGAKVVSLKMFQDNGSGYSSDMLLAMEYARENGIKILSVSIVITTGSEPWQPLVDAIAANTAAGVLSIFAASNEGVDLDCVAASTCRLLTVNPGVIDDPGLIKVGSTGKTDVRSGFSNYGLTKVHLFAPGEFIVSCDTVGYKMASGTSCACPLVAAAVSMLWAANPALTAFQVRDQLFASVDPVASLAGLCVTGGRLNVHTLLSTAASVAPAASAPRFGDRLYDVQGRRIDYPTRSGITFGSRKRVRIK